MHRKLSLLATAFVLVTAAQAAGEETERINSSKLSVTIDRGFPAIYEYRLGSATIKGDIDGPKAVNINGRARVPEISFAKTDDSTARYSLSFKDSDISFSVELQAAGQVVTGRITDIKEGKDKLRTVAFPDHQLLSVTSGDKAPAYIWTRLIPMVDAPDHYHTLAGAPAEKITANYAFVESGDLAAGIVSNVIDERERVAIHSRTTDNGKAVSLWCPVWTYRELDTETLEEPWFKVVVADDRNRDGQADWQDAALLYRTNVPRPYRADEVKKIVSSQIGFNASHLAENPFLRMFDNMKKCALLIDFLPQDLLVKGYQGGGHDSSVPDYSWPNIQAGGFKDMRHMIDNTGEFNINVGLHINCTEAYPESRYFDTEILQKTLGWTWGDQAVLIDKRKDLLSGKLFARIDEMFDSIPGIDFLYVDTYQDRGWPLIKIREKLESYDQRMYTEFDAAMDGVATWSHGRTRLKGKIARYIWNDCRDIFRLDPLLFGADHHGINGWEGEASVDRFVRETFTQNLPTKFLQHFDLLKWTDTEAIFSNGVRTTISDGHVTGTWNGMTFFEGAWDDKRRSFSDVKLSIPWEPDAEQPERVFLWNDTDNGSYTLPQSWKRHRRVYIYELTDRGRVAAGTAVVKNGRIDFSAKKGIPYVIYAKRTGSVTPASMKWGDGAAVADPGFNDYSLSSWTTIGDKDGVKVVKDRNGQTALEISAAGRAGVSQRLAKAAPGEAYFVSAMVTVDPDSSRKVRLRVSGLKNGEEIANSENYIDNSVVSGRKGAMRVRTYFAVPEEADAVELSVTADGCDKAHRVLVDDIRIYPTPVAGPDRECLLFEDFELRDIGWGPFVNTVRASIYTDLSEFNPGRTADVIDGSFSLKTWNHRKGLLYRTTPGLLRLAPRTEYTISFDYMCDRDDSYALVIKEDGKAESREIARIPIKRGKGVFETTFKTRVPTDAWFGIEKTDDRKTIFIMDNLTIR